MIEEEIGNFMNHDSNLSKSLFDHFISLLNKFEAKLSSK